MARARRHYITCRARVAAGCLHGLSTAREFGDDLPQSEDGTFDGHTIVCSVCYIALGTPPYEELPAAIAATKGAKV